MTATLTGLADVQRAVHELGEFAEPQVCEKALLPIGRRLAQLVSARFNAVTHRRTGRTADDFTAAVSKEGRETGVTRVLVGARTGKRGRGYISSFLEKGTAFVRARPHVRPTWDENRDGVIGEIRVSLKPALDATIKRLARFARSRGVSQ